MYRSLWEKVNDKNYPKESLKADFLTVLQEIFRDREVTKVSNIYLNRYNGCTVHFTADKQGHWDYLSARTLASPNPAKHRCVLVESAEEKSLAKRSLKLVELRKIRDKMELLQEQEKALVAELGAIIKELEKYEHG